MMGPMLQTYFTNLVNSLCLDVLNDSDSYYLGVCVLGEGGGGLPRYFDGGVCGGNFYTPFI